MPPAAAADGYERTERSPLLAENNEQHHIVTANKAQDTETTALRRRLYTSHFLSTWNSRVFEFGAVLYLATIFPGTLLPMSVYAFTRGFSAIVFASAIGLYIDTGNRMTVVRVSIIGQRLAVALSCVLFSVLSIPTWAVTQETKTWVLVLLACLACIEKLCSIMNLVSVEKDWVVVVARGDQDHLRALNAEMRRIDLICKLLGPLFIALIDGYSTQVAILVNLGMNVASVVIEYFAIAQVYHMVPELRDPRKINARVRFSEDQEQLSASCPYIFARTLRRVLEFLRRSSNDSRLYFTNPVLLPSFAGALLYLTVLSFAGQMVTYLLGAGYTSVQIGTARTLSVAFELVATWVAPWLIGIIGAVRAGLIFSVWQVSMLAAGFAVFWTLADNGIASASGLVIGTIASRVGLRGFDLCTQIIVQNGVEAEIRGAFSSVEAGWQNGFELISYASTIYFSRADQFKWPALISVVAVASASLIYATFVYIGNGPAVKELGSEQERETVE